MCAALAERTRFAEVVEHSVAIVHMIDTEMRWVAINRQAKLDFHQLYGTIPKVGDYLPDLMADFPQDRDLIGPLWQRALSDEQFTTTALLGI